MAKVWTVPEKAEKKFTDREDPRKAFWAKYTYLQNHMDENIILTYYGIGGIGKTSLIEQLCTELTQQNHLFAVVDFESVESKGKTKILRMLATQLMKDKSIKLFRFLAGMRWYAYNTGAPDFIVKEVDELLEDNRMLAGISEWVQATATITEFEEVLKQLTPMLPGVGPVVQIIRGIDKLRAGFAQYKSGKKVAQFLSALKLNENHPRKIEEELHTYFRDDLIDIMSKRNEPLVIFLDTYEVFTNIFQDRTVAIRNEQWLKEMIPYIPGILWVIAGRDKLEWEERYDAEQHLLGNLSENDTQKYLLGAGINTDLVDGLYKLTQGVPVFLDICVERHQELISEGKKPTFRDFGETTEKLIERYLRHMPVHMKTLAYVLSCLKKWNQDIVEAIAGKSKKFRYDVTEYNEFMKHSYIVKSADERYYMHDIMQNTIYNDKDFDLGLKNEINTLLEDYYIDTYNNKNNTDKTESLGGRVRAFCQTYSSIDEAVSIKLEELSAEIEALYALGQIHEQLIFSKELYEWIKKIPCNTGNEAVVNLKLITIMLLAYAYSNNGLYNQAVKYAQRALDISRDQFGGCEHLAIMGYLATYYGYAGRHQESLALAEKILDIQKNTFGSEHIETIDAVHNLAVCYTNVGRYQDAIDLSEKVLASRKRTLGDEHLKTIAAMNNLAVVYSEVGRHQESLALAEKALDIQKRVFGDEHPDTIASMNNIAIYYGDAGRYQDALVLLEEVLDSQKRIFGDEHPDTIGSMYNIALYYKDIGHYQDALELSEKVLGTRKRILGDEHPDTIKAMYNMVACYELVGRYQEVVPLAEKLLDVRKRTLGDEHLDTMAEMNDWAVVYSEVVRSQDALELLEKLLDVRKRILGDEHPDTMAAMDNLAVVYSEVGRSQDALELLEKLLDVRKRILGDEHPDTMAAMNDLAVVYSEVGRSQDALELLEKLLDVRKRILGAEYPDTICTMNFLAVVYDYVGRYQDALELSEKVLDARKRTLGEDHPDTIETMDDIAFHYSAVGRYQDALELYEKILFLQKRILGDEHPDTITAMSNLAICYDALGRYQDAYVFFAQTLQLSTRVLGENKDFTIKVMSHLAVVLNCIGKHTEAVEMKEKVLQKCREELGEDNSTSIMIKEYEDFQKI